MNKLVACLVLVCGLGIASSSGADGARPIRFWVSVMNPTATALAGDVKQYTWTPGAGVPLPISGWTCRMTEIRTNSFPAVPSVGWPASVYQTADLQCESASGTITLTTLCTLQSDPKVDSEHIGIKDPSGHRADVTAICSNHTAEEDALGRHQAGLP